MKTTLFFLNQRRAAVLAAVLLLALAGPIAAPASAKDAAVPRESSQFLARLSAALEDIAEAARPAVVNISTTSTISREEHPFGNLPSDPFFRRFFGDPFDSPGPKRKFRSSALGSGVIVTSDGTILTNSHVVKNADDIRVVLFDKREFKGRVVGVDSRTDLAVIKIDGTDLPSLRLADSGKLRTGDIVVAIGNPFGLGQTTTMGIVSAVGRSNVGIADFEDFIQTDAAINPGNSGGALVNVSGELVGINTAIFSTNGGYMGIGFAIPSSMARSVMDSIAKHGKVVRGWLGVGIQNLTPDLGDALGLKDREGALVASVESGSPAEKAGLKRGDLIIEVNGRKTPDAAALRNLIAGMAPGTSAEVKVLREGTERSIAAILGESPEGRSPKSNDHSRALRGVSVQELTPALRDRLKAADAVSGVVVTAVAPDSPARGVLQVNDIIQEIGRHPVPTVQDFDQAAAKPGEKDAVLLLVYRNGGSLYLLIKP